ncbi:MAG: tetratricopeptide repeat protein, partial [Cyanobacteria bacterium J06598_3]
MTAAMDLEGLFQAGVTAYKQGDYNQATISLTQLSKSSSQAYRVKAAMGLVRTYIAQKDWEKAEALCQKLAKSPKLSVQQWAAKMLQKIEPQKPSVTPVMIGRSGFQPLSPEPPADGSGAKKGAGRDDSGVRQSDRAANRSQAKGLRATSSGATTSAAHTTPEQGSMFDYSYLNGSANEVAADGLVTPEGTVSQATTSGATSADSPLFERGPKTGNEAIAAPLQAPCTWLEAGRLKQGRSLGKMKRSQLLMAQLGGAISFYVLSRYLLLSAIVQVNNPLRFLDGLLPFWVRQIPLNPKVFTWQLLVALGVLTLVSPWLWDVWLRFTANRQSFSNQKLRTHSPEAATVLAKHCTKRRWPFPTLWKLPTDVPLIFSYGWLPRNTRLVVSDGLLAQLE